MGEIARTVLSCEGWGDDRADRTGIDRAVGMPAHLLVDGADVEAGAAADAGQGLALQGCGELIAATIVQQYEVDGLGAFGVWTGLGSGEEGLVGGHGLPGCRSWEEAQEHIQVSKTWNDLLDTGDRHVHLRQGRA